MKRVTVILALSLLAGVGLTGCGEKSPAEVAQCSFYTNLQATDPSYAHQQGVDEWC